MSATTDKVIRDLSIASMGIQALETIAESARGLLTSSPTTDAILAVLQGIVAVSDSIQQGLEGTVDPAGILAGIDELKNSLASNNSVVDAKVNAKFPTG
jgi:hypothetical protein